MIIISHRGNLAGPDKSRENKLFAIRECLDLGYDVEMDVWLRDEKYYLGHDGPDGEEVPFTLLAHKGVWVHAKTPETFAKLSSFGARGIWNMINAFYHTTEGVVLTTRGYLWCHSNTPIPGKSSVIVHPVRPEHLEAYAICTDTPQAFSLQVEKNELPKLVLLDVDGVLTDGRKGYALDGSVAYKQFCDRDFTAIKRFQEAGILVALISGDKRNRSMVSFPRGLTMIDTNFQDKITLLPRICDEFGVRPEEILFVGDDYYDIALMSSVGLAYCPNDALEDVKQVARCLTVNGGYGVVQELYGRFQARLRPSYPVDSAAVNP